MSSTTLETWVRFKDHILIRKLQTSTGYTFGSDKSRRIVICRCYSITGRSEIFPHLRWVRTIGELQLYSLSSCWYRRNKKWTGSLWNGRTIKHYRLWVHGKRLNNVEFLLYAFKLISCIVLVICVLITNNWNEFSCVSVLITYY